jgi:hypothetical protein
LRRAALRAPADKISNWQGDACALVCGFFSARNEQSNATTAVLTIDRDTAGRFGIQPPVIDDTLYDAFG